jgi:hypothetical protein
MEITLKEVSSRKDLKAFIYLPEKIHKDHKYWLPPVYMDDWNYFNPKKNKAFTYSDTILLLALKGEEVVGRIMGIINHRYNEFSGEKTARFGYLETWEDEAVVQKLLQAVEDWAREREMSRIIGPYGFTDQDPEGFLIEGFENKATIATYYNFSWMPEMVEKQGYTKDIDYYVYQLEVPKEFPEFYKRIYERVKKKGQFEMVEFRKKKEIKPWIIPVLDLMNETYSKHNIYGYTPLDEREMKDLAKRYMPILDPRFIKGIRKGEELVAFIIAMPDITDGIRAARGRLLPFGFIKVLRAAKKTKQLDLLLGAVKEKYQGRGLDAMMGVRTIESAHEANLEVMDTHHEMESNVKVRGIMIKMGGKLYKKYRVYQKDL